MVGNGVKTNKWGLVHFRSHCPLDYFLIYIYIFLWGVVTLLRCVAGDVLVRDYSECVVKIDRSL